MVLGSHLGVPCGLDLQSQSLVIESFSVGSRAVLRPWGEGFCGSRFKVFYGSSFWGHKRNNMSGEIYCRFWYANERWYCASSGVQEVVV